MLNWTGSAKHIQVNSVFCRFNFAHLWQQPTRRVAQFECLRCLLASAETSHRLKSPRILEYLIFKVYLCFKGTYKCFNCGNIIQAADVYLTVQSDSYATCSTMVMQLIRAAAYVCLKNSICERPFCKIIFREDGEYLLKWNVPNDAERRVYKNTTPWLTTTSAGEWRSADSHNVAQWLKSFI